MNFKGDFKTIYDVLDGMELQNYMCMSRVIQGHELWFQDAVRDGGCYHADLMFGHNMNPDGSAPDDYVHPTVFDAEGNIVETRTENLGNGHRISFRDTGKAPYTMYNESVPIIWNIIKGGKWEAGLKRDFKDVESSSSFEMYAKAVFSDGEASHTEQSVLEIVPGTGKLKVGTDAVFTVLYEGRPLTGQDVKFYCKGTDETRMVRTDRGGRAVLEVTDPGNWMVLMRYRDDQKSSEDEFDDSVFITTLVMKAE